MFDLGDFVVDRVLYGWAESLSGDILYTLKQMTNVNLSVEAQSKDQLDATDMLVKRFYQSKTGTLSVESTVLSFSTVGAISGSGVENSSTNMFEMPKFVRCQAGDTISLSSPILDTVTVFSVDTNGTCIKEYERGTEASATEYAITTGNKLMLPTKECDDVFFLVKYQRNPNNAIKIVNRANRFPKNVCLNIKAIGISTCDVNSPKLLYIQMPNFQPSPDLDISFNTEGTISYSGNMMPDVCSEDKRIFSVFAIPESEEAPEFEANDLRIDVLTRPEASFPADRVQPLITEDGRHYKAHSYLKQFLTDNYNYNFT